MFGVLFDVIIDYKNVEKLSECHVGNTLVEY